MNMSDNYRLARLEMGLGHLKRAVEELRELKTDSESGSLAGDAGYYVSQIEEFISCDHGEAGLEALVSIVSKR